MSEITDFAGGDIKHYDSFIEKETALPNSTSYTSDAFNFGKAQSSMALKVVANGAVAIANAATLKIELYDSADGTTYALKKTLLDYTNGTGGTVTRASGYEFVNFVPGDDVETWCKIVVTTTTDLSAKKYDAYLHYIPRLNKA